MKMIKRKGLTYLLSIALFFSVSSCDLFDLDINTDPNNPSQASLNLLLTQAQLEGMRTLAGGLNDATMGFVAQTTSFDDFSMTNASWNGTWNFLYSGPLTDLESIIVAAEADGNNPRYLGIAQILKAYYFTTMVDLWGDVPYFEAFKGLQGIKTPVYTPGDEVYADALVLLNEAIANLALPSPVAVQGDLIYAGNAASWTRFANSLKLRLLINTRNVNPNAAADIQALVTAGGFISTAAQDAQFRFGALNNPDDRHPMYQSGYAGGEAAYTYFGHQFMYEMLRNRDPRTPFYFKRQTSDILDPSDPTQKQTIPCSQRDDCVYNYFPISNLVANGIFGKDAADLTNAEASYLAGFFGRDRSDPSGVPNDNPIRTTVGAYPAAGLFDDVAELGGGNKGSGAGIFPIITSWMVKFYLAEAMITLGTTVTGETETTLLTKAMNEQMAKVLSVGTAADANAVRAVTAGSVSAWSTYGWPVTYTAPTSYVSSVAASYPAAGSANVRLNYMLKQAWYCNFGNGFDTYNAYRRTGLPNDLQAPLQLPRQFALRLPYAQDELNLNGNTPLVVYDSPNDAIFWDVLKLQF